MPYWLKGYIGCAYLLNDKRMIDESKAWIEGALRGQQSDGWFGPGKGRTGVATNLKGREDLWPNMIMLFALQTYYDCTGDKRVIDCMTRYFKYLAEVPEDRFLVGLLASHARRRSALQHPLALQPHGRGVAVGAGEKDAPPHRPVGQRRYQLA